MKIFQSNIFGQNKLLIKSFSYKNLYSILAVMLMLALLLTMFIGNNHSFGETEYNIYTIKNLEQQTLYIKENNFKFPNLPGTSVALMKDKNQNNSAIVLVSGRHDGGQSYICQWDQTNHTFDSNELPCQPIGPNNAPADMAVVGNFGSGNSPKADIIIENGGCNVQPPQCSNYSAAVLYLKSENYTIQHPLTTMTNARSIATGDINQDGYDDIVLGFAGSQANLALINSGVPFNFTSLNFPNSGEATLGLAIATINHTPYVFATSRQAWSQSTTQTSPENNTIPNGSNFKLSSSNEPLMMEQVSSFGDPTLQSVGIAIGPLESTTTNYLLVANGGQADYPAQFPELFTVNNAGHVSLVTTPTIITSRASQSRPVLFYDIMHHNLNDVVIGNLNNGTNPPEPSIIYINNGGLNFTPINIPNSELYEPRGMAIGQFGDELLLVAANYCNASNTKGPKDCKSKFYQISNQPISRSTATTTVDFKFQPAVLGSVFSSDVNKFTQITITDLTQQQSAVAVLNQYTLSSQQTISTKITFPLTDQLNITVTGQDSSGTNITATCQNPITEKQVLNYSIDLSSGTNSTVICNLVN